MPTLLERSERYSARAWQVVNELKIVEHWKAVGACANLVGSLRTGLLMKHRDVDFHIYSDPFSIAASFEAVGRIASHPHIRSVTYSNLLEADDRCLEWHAIYAPDGQESWQIDMIHLHPESRYVGVFEDVADRIERALTPETRHAILAIKDGVPDGEKAMGIRVYQAAIRDGVRTYDEFREWEAKNPADGIITWAP